MVYGLDHPDPCCIVVPQTGEVMLVDPKAIPTQLAILAKEKSNPSRQSRLSTIIDIIEDYDEDEILDDDDDDYDFQPHTRSAIANFGKLFVLNQLKKNGDFDLS